MAQEKLKPQELEVLRQLRVLYVEDEEDILKFSAMVLEDYVSKLHVSCNAKEALSILEKNEIDLLITDILMPKMSGIELIREIKKSQKYSNLNIIITTAHTQTQYLLDAIELGVDGYVLKPIDIGELLSTILRAVLPKFQAKELHLQNLLINAISVFVGGKKIEIIKYLMEHCDKDNIFYGSYEDIIAALGVSKPTVVKTFKQLMDTGLLERIKNKVYRFSPDIGSLSKE